jgi:hypothetical protein
MLLINQSIENSYVGRAGGSYDADDDSDDHHILPFQASAPAYSRVFICFSA